MSKETLNKYKSIDCDEHGKQHVCFVCLHLVNDSNQGFNPATEKDKDSDFSECKEAFCDRCYKWFNRIWPFSMIYFIFVAKPKAICELCFTECQKKNDVHKRDKAWWESNP